MVEWRYEQQWKVKNEKRKRKNIRGIAKLYVSFVFNKNGKE